MRVAIATRIFAPEPGAAAFRLAALAEALQAGGHETLVLTVRPPTRLRNEADAADYRIRRWPVLRDSSGYVRGYLQYLSFDVPLFFRILFGKKMDAIIVEPPPTTMLFATMAAWLRRIPVFSYAADVWSDATRSTGAPDAVVRAVRRMESFAWNRSRGVFAVNEGVAVRVRDIATNSIVETVGNGVDTKIFTPTGTAATLTDSADQETVRYAIYSGTASEWQGADVFIRAIAQLSQTEMKVEIVFLGQGTALPELQRLSKSLNVKARFLDPVPPAEAAEWMRGATMSLASILPEAGYDFAYPTKIFAAWGCGIPVLYAGPGPARKTLNEHSFLGEGVDHDVTAVADAMRRIFARAKPDSASIAGWAQENVSLAGVAHRVVDFMQVRLRG